MPKHSIIIAGCAALAILGQAFPAAAQAPAAQQAAPSPQAATAEAILRRYLEGMAKGEPNYDDMAQSMANAVRQRAPTAGPQIAALGPIQSMAYLGSAGAAGQAHRFEVVFAGVSQEYTVSLNPDGKLAGLGLRPMAGAQLDDAALADFIRARLDQVDYSGAVLFARPGQPPMTFTRGFSDREGQVPIALDDRFRVGSMNKMMTAVAVMQLVQAGKVRLDAPLATYLPDYPNAEFARAVTIHQLLTHTGGAGDHFGPEYSANHMRLRTLQDYVDMLGARPGQFPPGSAHVYANFGFILLGRVVEQVSGQSYPDYVRDHISRPAGMTGAGFEPEPTPVSGRVKAYTTAAGRIVPLQSMGYSGTSAGGGLSTVGDFLAFANALTSHKLLDAQHLALMTARKAGGAYAYGFQDFSQGGLRIYGHGGTAAGENGMLWIVEGQAVIVALSNVYPPGLAQQLVPQIGARARFTSPNGALVQVAPGAPAPTDAERAALFAANDPDGDGRIDKAAYRKVLEAMAYAEQLETLFAQRDADRDGFITRAEYTGQVALAAPLPRQGQTAGARPPGERHGTDATVRQVLDSIAAGAPDYTAFVPAFADQVRTAMPRMQPRTAARGPIQSIDFAGLTPQGDRYRVQYAHAALDVTLRTQPDGKIAGLGMATVPPTPAQRQAAFKAADTNADGKLDKAAYRQLLSLWALDPQADALFAHNDADKDGFVSAAEYERAGR